MKTFLELMKRYYSFRWFQDTWSVKEKWLYVALYVVLFNISLIPILVISEWTGVLTEGSSGSLGLIAVILVLWFAIYQPIFNFFMTR